MKTASRTVLLALLVAAALVAAFAFPRLRRFVEVDACLDRGGAWDYDGQRCRQDTGAAATPAPEEPAPPP